MHSPRSGEIRIHESTQATSLQILSLCDALRQPRTRVSSKILVGHPGYTSEIREIRLRPRLRHCKCCPCDAQQQPRGSGVVEDLGHPGCSFSVLTFSQGARFHQSPAQHVVEPRRTQPVLRSPPRAVGPQALGGRVLDYFPRPLAAAGAQPTRRGRAAVPKSRRSSPAQ